MTEPLRTLHFDRLDQAVEEMRRLLSVGYQRRGQWSLAQASQHLRIVQDCSIDGYPKWMSLFFFVRPVVRAVLLPKVFAGNSPQGLRTASVFVPADDLDDEKEVARFVESVERFHNHRGSFHPHPGFGRLDRETLGRLHAAHAAHHLRFLEPVDA